MNNKIHQYPLVIKETHLDSFGHVNNAVYLTLFEDARWEVITQNGYGIEKIKSTGMGPVILELNLKFTKELRDRDQIIIETEPVIYNGKIGTMMQKMIRNGEVCCILELKVGLFDIHARKLVQPTQDWLNAVT